MIAVVPLALFVTCWVVEQSLILAATTSAAAAGVLLLLQFGAQHFTGPIAHVPLRERPAAVVSTAVVLGLLTGGAMGFAALVAGFHGNAPTPWLYLCGPVAWVLPLAGNETSYLCILGILTPFTWIAYWGFLIAGTSRLTGFQRSMLVALFHFASAGAYHILVGIS